MFVKTIYLIISVCSLYVIGCSSGPYELDETTIDEKEKTIVADTTKTVTEKREIKENISKQTEAYNFIVQIGAYAVPSNFERFMQRAKGDFGDDVYSVLIAGINRIRMGKFDNKAEALVLLEKVKKLGYYDAFIITVRTK